MSSTVRILYFAALREQLGDGMAWPLIGASTVAQLRAALRAQNARAHALLDPARGVRAAVNQVLTGEDAVVAPGDEVAFFPPVTGG